MIKHKMYILVILLIIGLIGININLYNTYKKECLKVKFLKNELALSSYICLSNEIKSFGLYKTDKDLFEISSLGNIGSFLGNIENFNKKYFSGTICRIWSPRISISILKSFQKKEGISQDEFDKVKSGILYLDNICIGFNQDNPK